MGAILNMRWSDKLDVQLCSQHCAYYDPDEGHEYFGIANGQECYCGNLISNHILTDAALTTHSRRRVESINRTVVYDAPRAKTGEAINSFAVSQDCDELT
ncbi:hypothetical protein PMIN04_011081 [Paraphaeosphaeria minitans]